MAKTIQSGIIPEILAQVNNEPYGLLGVSTCMDGTGLDYYIAAATTKDTPENMSDYTIPEGFINNSESSFKLLSFLI